MATKMTSGVLFQDKWDTSCHWGPIGFLAVSSKGQWYWKRRWFRDQWLNEYDLEPPAPGKCFEVEIEL